ncbi:hypothetical protein SPRG_15616 [Saprolegnia parasitica CBS 223.65]|uniref:PA domain-containing protein n=1 Tax=Saprolegnia parasitica (strain CBS 223.65) TaxID=695850 RepID=A0A067BR27_SAPPC|nr:hypothetical protein SPRG_15616 [Saprolegnia parasitica CBS 223.65]KDO16761.1 hypothetical protein SPRG_15616 [Saprolegnia parasitica CBS 223.65]|eukprot:XP_012212533.1 hypothetical protein SPRG_15616 [Saprolegnia parasitica CBS 223.65]
MRSMLVAVVAVLSALTSALVVQEPCCATLRHIHARFGRRVGNTDEYSGLELVAARPLDGCRPLRQDLTGKVALVQRGGCNFAFKILQAQRAHAKAVIVMDNYPRPRNESWAIRMVPDNGNSTSVVVPSVFVSHETGDRLLGTLQLMREYGGVVRVALNRTGEILPLATAPAIQYQESLETMALYLVLALVGIAVVHWLQRT